MNYGFTLSFLKFYTLVELTELWVNHRMPQKPTLHIHVGNFVHPLQAPHKLDIELEARGVTSF